MSKRVTDLEKFSLEQIWRPYQNKPPHSFEERLNSPPYNLGDTARMLQEDNDWSRAVLSRLRGIGFTFPAYLRHPLVDVVKAALRPDGSRDRLLPENDDYREGYSDGYADAYGDVSDLKAKLLTLKGVLSQQQQRYDELIAPFRSGGDWGYIKALIVNGAPDLSIGRNIAKKITEAQAAIDQSRITEAGKAALEGGKTIERSER